MVYVLADADIEHASRAIVYDALLFPGQLCMSSERLIVQRQVFDPLVAQLSSGTSIPSLSGILSNQAHLLSLFSDRSADNIIAMLKEAKEAGAAVLLDDMGKAGPALLKPHIVTRVRQVHGFGSERRLGLCLSLPPSIPSTRLSNSRMRLITHWQLLSGRTICTMR